jgi:hypothetical protein
MPCPALRCAAWHASFTTCEKHSKTRQTRGIREPSRRGGRGRRRRSFAHPTKLPDCSWRVPRGENILRPPPGRTR